MFIEETPPETLEAADAALTAGLPDPEGEPAAEPAAEPTQPRDAEGRFTEKPPTEEPEAPVEGEPAPEETPAEPAELPTAEPVEEELPDEPFAYRADNQDFSVPGSAVGEDGVFIPAAEVPQVQQLLSAGKAAFGSVRQRLSDAAQREQVAMDRATAAEAQAQQILAHFETLIEKGQVQAWLENVQQNWPILKAEAKAKAVELQNQSTAKRLQEYEAREQQTRLQPLIEQTLQQSVWTQGRELGLDDRTIQAVFERLKAPEQRDLLVVSAPFDDPSGGFRKGESVMNHSLVRGALELAGINRQPPAQQQKIAAAVKANTAAAKPAKIPPTVGGKGRVPSPGTPKFKTAAEADDFLLEGDLDTLVEG
jgi:hypothetical protein